MRPNRSRTIRGAGECVGPPAKPWAIDDVGRMAAVADSGLLCLTSHEPFDRITRLVTATLGVPRSTVTVVLPDRQLFPGQTGLTPSVGPTRETPIAYSFCRHPAETGQPLVVGDARTHPVFKDNPSVDLGVIAYCGVPLLSAEGITLGAVCAIDAKPRRWTAADVRFLRGVAAVVTDQVTSQAAMARHVRTLQDLRAAESKFKTFMEHSPAVAFIKDEDGRFLYVNRTMQRYYPECVNWIGRSAEDLWPADVAAALRADDRRAVQHELGVEVVESVDAADGTPNHWRTFKFPLVDGDGRTLLAGMSVNINDRKRIEADLRAARGTAEAAAARAEAANVAKSAFLSNMSHEIRTPLTAIFGFADMLLADDSPGHRRECVQTIRRNGVHLLGIINDILDLSKIEADQMVVEHIPVPLPQLLADVINLLRHRAVDKGIDLTLVYLTPVPERIESDPTRLRQVLINLVGNALKFTATGGVELRVGLDESIPDAPVLQVAVADTGIGLTPEQLQGLFTPFSQADVSHTRQFGGTGLGLSISRRLARLLGGDLTVASEPGQGSTFTVTVPAGDLTGVARLTDAATAPITAATADAPAPALSGRVLLAEDSPDNQRLLSYHLTTAGATVDVADDGRAAVDRALDAARAGRPYDLILMDIQMPRLDGYAATAELRQAGYARPIVALTASAMDHERDRCLQSGCDDFLTKPIQTTAFRRTVARYLKADRPPVAAPRVLPLASDLASHAGIAPLLAPFLTGLAENAGLIRRAVAAGDVEQVRRVSHQIRGSAGGYGYPTVTAAAATVEDAAFGPVPSPALVAAVDRLVNECDRAVAGRPAQPPCAAA